jgi:hypothetical protein
VSPPWEKYTQAEGPWTRYAPTDSAVPDRAKPKTVGAAMVQESPRLEPGPRTATMPDEGRPWGEVASSFARNILPTTGKAVLGSVNALTLGLPQTAAGLYDLGKGVVTKINRYQPAPGQTTMGPRPPTPEQAESEATADAVGGHYATKYGTGEGFKNALADDPGSILMDVTTLGTAGAGLPGTAGRVAGIVSKADPLAATGNVLKYGAKGAGVLGANVLGGTTGAGTNAIQSAGRAGREGGEAAKVFRENIKGDVPITDIVDRAKAALDMVRQDRSAAYKAGMADVTKNQTPLDFGPIEAALGNASEIGSYKGVTVNRSAGKTMDDISAIVNEWKGYDPADFHTIEGLDALKRTIGDLRDSTEQGTPARVAADRVYNAVKDQIRKADPKYADVMDAYSTASKTLNEATKTFSLRDNALDDTAARKLLSTTRNNVQTNYGERGRLLNVLSEHDPNLPYAIAGQATNALLPRGLVARGGLMAAAPSLAGAAVANPLNALGAAAFSPRIVGNTVYFGGKVIGAVEDVAERFGITADRLRALGQGGYQAGRPEDIRQRAMDLRSSNALAAP